jgi:hypothetical protein
MGGLIVKEKLNQFLYLQKLQTVYHELTGIDELLKGLIS